MPSGYSLKCFKLWWTHGKGRAQKMFSCACHLTFGCMLGLQRSFKTLQTDIKMRATMEPAKSALLGVGPSTEYLLEAVPCYARVQLCWKVLFSGAPYQPQPATGPTPCLLLLLWALRVNLPHPRNIRFGSHCGCPFKMSEAVLAV